MFKLPTSVRYVKNGRGGQWWRAANTNGQVHLGWNRIPKELLLRPDFGRINQLMKLQYGSRQGFKQDFNQLRDLLDAPSQHIWVTFEDGCLWWCTVRDGVVVNPGGESSEQGNFCLTCDRRWSNQSVKGRQLAISDLPGTVTVTAGFKGTVCTPKNWSAVLRIIKDQQDPAVVKAAHARTEYTRAVGEIVRRLSPQDFEQLIDLVLNRTGWVRISTLGKTREGIDLEAENVAAGEIAFVQVKSSATQKDLNDYVERFKKRQDRYTRMIFAVHSPAGKLRTDFPAVKIWAGERIAELVVRLGLGDWVENKLA